MFIFATAVVRMLALLLLPAVILLHGSLPGVDPLWPDPTVDPFRSAARNFWSLALGETPPALESPARGAYELLAGVPPVPAPLPRVRDPHGLDFPPMPAWDFYDEFRIDPDTALAKYRGRTVTLAYVRGLVQPDTMSGQGSRFAAVQPYRSNTSEADWWGLGAHRYVQPAPGEDFQLVCNHHLGLFPWVGSRQGLDQAVRELERRTGTRYSLGAHPEVRALREGWETRWDDVLYNPSYLRHANEHYRIEYQPPFTGEDQLRLEAFWEGYRRATVLGRGQPYFADSRPGPADSYDLLDFYDGLHMDWRLPWMEWYADAWNDYVFVVRAEVAGMDRAPPRPEEAPRPHWRVRAGDAHVVELDNCAAELMDLTQTELKAWQDHHEAGYADPAEVPYRPVSDAESHLGQSVARPVDSPYVVTVKRTVLRHGPDGIHEIASWLEAGTILTSTGRRFNSKWLEVEDPNDSAGRLWIYEASINPLPTADGN